MGSGNSAIESGAISDGALAVFANDAELYAAFARPRCQWRGELEDKHALKR